MSHLENVSEDEINRLLGMVVDVENLFMSVHKEEDTDTKQVLFLPLQGELPSNESVSGQKGGWEGLQLCAPLISTPPSSCSSW